MLDLGIVVAPAILDTLAICTRKAGEVRLAIVEDLAILPAGALGAIVLVEGFGGRRVRSVGWEVWETWGALLAQFYISSTFDDEQDDEEGKGEHERAANAGANGSQSTAGVRGGGCAGG